MSAGEALTAEKITEAGEKPTEAVANYALRLGDDALILAQRLGWWIARAPELEEDVALANIALDQLGHARSFLSYAALAWDKTEDDLAYFRTEPEFLNLQLVEQPNGDFAATIARQLIISYYQFELYRRLVESPDSTLAAIAAKAVKEVDYHRDHATQWVLRLSLGTEESRRRMIDGLASMWPYVDELFRDDDFIGSLGSTAVLPSSLRDDFDALTGAVLDAAELERPEGFVARGGGREGIHTEFMGPLLAEMQVLARAHPRATW
ncbi:MAG: 1,2-phenylacetyl-CoA epoxidase subunit PaaC [Terrimesophilobacter sp.]